MRKWLIIGLTLALVGLGLYVYGFHKGRKSVPADIRTVTDTLTIRDTISLEKPVYIERYIIDTLLVAIGDTVVLHDTVYVKLPKEQKVYGDTTYRAWVSGYKPNLDSIHIYNNTKYITDVVTKEVRKSGWGFGLTAGPSAGYGPGGFTAGVSVAVGLTWLPK